MDFAALSTALITNITTALTSVQGVLVLVVGAVVAYGLFRTLVGKK